MCPLAMTTNLALSHQKTPAPRYLGGKEGNGGTAPRAGAAGVHTVTQRVAAGMRHPQGARPPAPGASLLGHDAL